MATDTVAASSTQDVAQSCAVDLSGTSPKLKDQGRVSGGYNTYTFFPSIDINTAGQIGMKDMKPGKDTTNDYMSMYITGRIPSHAAVAVSVVPRASATSTNARRS